MSFKLTLLPAILLAGCVFVSNTAQAAPCPYYKVGAYDLTKNNQQKVFISTAMVEIQDTQQDSIDLATAEAEIAARAGLQTLSNFPQNGSQMSGVIDVSQCVAGLKVYASVKFTSQSNVSAKNLRDAMSNSLKNNPTPQSR
jgi:hypothetical protein